MLVASVSTRGCAGDFRRHLLQLLRVEACFRIWPIFASSYRRDFAAIGSVHGKKACECKIRVVPSHRPTQRQAGYRDLIRRARPTSTFKRRLLSVTAFSAAAQSALNADLVSGDKHKLSISNLRTAYQATDRIGLTMDASEVTGVPPSTIAPINWKR